MVRIFHSSIGESPVVGSEKIEQTEILIESQNLNSPLRWSFKGLKIEKGGANNQLYLLTHSSSPGWTVYVRDRSVIEKLKDRAPYLVVPRKPIVESGFSIAIVGVGVILLFFTLLWSLKDPAIELAIKNFPIKYEAMLGEAVINQMIGAESGQFEEPRKALIELLTPLVKEAKAAGYDLKVYIHDDPSLNAFALPGGFIAFNRGFLENIESAEEILGVGAHELAHVTKRHSLRQMAGHLGTYFVIQLFLGDVTGILAIFVENSQFLLSKMHSREAEKEADLVGLEYLRKNKISGEGLLTFLKKADEKNREKQKKLGAAGEALGSLDFLSTHPASSERFDYLRSEIDRLSSDPDNQIQPVQFDLKKIKDHFSKQ